MRKTQAKIYMNKHMHIEDDKGHNKATWAITKFQLTTIASAIMREE
jgi:hypothetical protein